VHYRLFHSLLEKYETLRLRVIIHLRILHDVFLLYSEPSVIRINFGGGRLDSRIRINDAKSSPKKIIYAQVNGKLSNVGSADENK
jgi:hypothetical protein